ncbi:hypothetical protein [Chromobacterium haemolyticum]|nr:hypothetical protein [Chromobacterium haemolyticum]
MKVNSTRQNHTIHLAHVDEPELLRLVTDAIAQQLGLDARAANVKVRAYTTSYSEGSLGTGKTRVVVEITEDHAEQVSAEPADA